MLKIKRFIPMLILFGLSLLFSGCFTVVSQSAFSGHRRAVRVKEVTVTERVISPREAYEENEELGEYAEEDETEETD